jgi:hypothetical protein
MKTTKYRQKDNKANEIGWMAGAKKRFKDAENYRIKVLGIDTDKWEQLRFEYACQFAESIADDYHALIRNIHYMDAFKFQWLKHDIELFDAQVEGNYEAIKRDMIQLHSVEQFILSYINSPACR